MMGARATDDGWRLTVDAFARRMSLARAYAALDAMEAKLAALRGVSAASGSRYLGECHRAHDGVFHAYANACGARIVLEYGGEVGVREVSEDFDVVAEAYARVMSGPFAEEGGRIESAAFARAVASLGG